MSENTPHYATAQCDRPARPIELAVQQSEQLARMAANIQDRLHTVLGRLHQGTSPATLERNSKGLNAPEPELPELLQLERNLAKLDRELNSILDATNAFESL